MPHKAATKPPQKQFKGTKQRNRRLLAGASAREEESDGEAREEGESWGWLYASGTNDTEDRSDETEPEDAEDEGATEGRSTRKAPTHIARRIYGARNGSFICKVGHCVLLKQEGTEPWAGMIRAFSEDGEGIMRAEIMCKYS